VRYESAPLKPSDSLKSQKSSHPYLVTLTATYYIWPRLSISIDVYVLLNLLYRGPRLLQQTLPCILLLCQWQIHLYPSGRTVGRSGQASEVSPSSTSRITNSGLLIEHRPSVCFSPKDAQLGPKIAPALRDHSLLTHTRDY
jgi:hypothetical protein